ncbi:MAG: UDP-N-acetylmuramoyl-L-alanine--D-glutamate ligase [Planctomycetaceae bacterium]|nr:UDP-N-acetylmuramoyl-L-alanine--D-glutamate ligase [Planctomycetaceae bacterium]
MKEQPRNPDLTTIAGQRVTVMGLGGFGGGAAAVRFLAERGAVVRVSDQRSTEHLKDTLAELNDLKGVDWQLGEHHWSHFSDADFVVLNPAVPPCHPIVLQLEAVGIPLTSEMNLFWELNRGRVIAVTGSNGKSTTTALIHSIMQASGQRCWLGGNIGCSLLPHVDEIAVADWVILEASSFQLHLLDRIKARPDIAVVTNFAPNHLDWHGTLDEYRHAKQTILRWQMSDDFCILNGDDTDVAAWPHSANTTFVYSGPPGELLSMHDAMQAWLDEFGTAHILRRNQQPNILEFPINDWCTLRGRHNLSNALFSIAAAQLAGSTEVAIRQGLEKFEALPHRLQLVGELEGRRFYNDSISTTPESTIAALDSFDEPVVILAGGYDKQIDLTNLSKKIAARAKAASLLGQTAPTLKSGIATANAHLPIESCPDFGQAFAWAVEQSSPGDIILLSPGCASYDWFKSFVDRGDQFCRLVKQLRNRESIGF